jgi:hypothetical protein
MNMARSPFQALVVCKVLGLQFWWQDYHVTIFPIHMIFHYVVCEAKSLLLMISCAFFFVKLIVGFPSSCVQHEDVKIWWVDSCIL